MTRPLTVLFTSWLAACGANEQRGDRTPSDVETLPVFRIQAGFEIPDEPKVPCTVRIDVPAGDDPAFAMPEMPCGIELRGNLSQRMPKLSYNLELRDSTGEERAHPLLGMHANADWALHAMYLDPSLMRGKLSFDLFLAADRWAPSMRFIELFLNDEYRGVFVLGEKINRESLDMAEWDAQGSLIYKAANGAANFEETAFGRPKSSWHEGYEIKYPRHFTEPEAAVWQALDRLVELTATADDSQFFSEIGALIEIGRLIDLHLLLLFTNNLDGVTTNYVLARDQSHVASEPFVMLPWDYDATFGQTWEGGWATTGEWLSNRLFDRLLADDAYRAAWCGRWTELTEESWTVAQIDELIDANLDRLGDAPVRNASRWPLDGPFYLRPTTFEDEIEYIRSWTRDHTAWLESTHTSRCN